MKKELLSIVLLPILLFGEKSVDSNKTENAVSYRDAAGMARSARHINGEIRAGFIDLNMRKNSADTDSSALALGGHLHLNTQRWHGVMLGLEGYLILDAGFFSEKNPDFFDKDGDSFALLSQAYLDGEWGNISLRIGRQLLDTPHADSDDIRMMPNYFSAAVVTCTAAENLIFTLGHIDRMAGWENSTDASRFVPVEEALGADSDTYGIFMLSALYEGIENISLEGWYYLMDDIADVIYLEAAFESEISHTRLKLGLQYDTASGRGRELLSDIKSETLGLSVEVGFEDTGIVLFGAYNLEYGSTGAFASLGGGPFFTSMEDQTMDAIGCAGSAWAGGIVYDLGKIGLNGIKGALFAGRFVANDPDDYDTTEIDITAEYEYGKNISVTAALAMINDLTAADQDRTQFRMIMNYSF
jgi:hypothetical protein